MKFRFAMLPAFLMATSMLVASTGQVHAGVISSTEYTLANIDGQWAWGNSGHNEVSSFGYVANVADLSIVDGMMSDGYAAAGPGANAPHGNGIYTWGASSSVRRLEFAMNGGADFTLDELSFLSTRSWADFPIGIDYRLDGGSWINADVSTTYTELGHFNNFNGAAKIATLSFGGIVADEFRLTLSAGANQQLSVHEVIVSGSLNQVPEPASLAIFGTICLVACGRRRRS